MLIWGGRFLQQAAEGEHRSQARARARMPLIDPVYDCHPVSLVRAHGVGEVSIVSPRKVREGGAAQIPAVLVADDVFAAVSIHSPLAFPSSTAILYIRAPGLKIGSLPCAARLTWEVRSIFRSRST